MERVTRELAFAKLNLTLDVREKRPDGYHNMEMVMQSVSLYDVVDITISDEREKKIEVASNRDDLPTDLHNLAGKAANAFLEYTGRRGIGVSVYITKRIPDKAGMAGGSSDAAAVIRALARLLDTRMTDEEMYRLCLAVGSDVPFCLRGGTVLARGRGEILTDLPPMPECDIVLVKPDFSVSTPALFAALDNTPVADRPDTAGAVEALRRGDLKALCGNMVNVFENALPESGRRTVEDIRSALLDAGALGAAMTGTGSVVFGVFPAHEGTRDADFDRFGRIMMVSPTKKL